MGARMAHDTAVPETFVIDTPLTPEECTARIRERSRNTWYRPKFDPLRPVMGSASPDGFRLRLAAEWSKTTVAEARGRYLPDLGGRTRVEARIGTPWRYQLKWMVVIALVFAPLAAYVSSAVRRGGFGPVDPTRFAVAFVGMFALFFVIEFLMVAYALWRWAPKQRTILRSFLEEALRAR